MTIEKIPSRNVEQLIDHDDKFPSQENETCLAVIDEAVSDEPGVVGVKVDTDQQHVAIDYDASVIDEPKVEQIAQQMDELPAGQGVIGVLLFVVIVLFLVLLITDLVGATDVFPFINKNR